MRGLVLVSVLVAALVTAGAAASGRAEVRLLAFAPLVVRGTGFAPHDRVVVTVRAPDVTRTARVEASATGGFTARFARALPLPHCGTVTVTAVGSRGDRVAWKTPPQVCGTELGP